MTNYDLFEAGYRRGLKGLPKEPGIASVYYDDGHRDGLEDRQLLPMEYRAGYSERINTRDTNTSK